MISIRTALRRGVVVPAAALLLWCSAAPALAGVMVPRKGYRAAVMRLAKEQLRYIDDGNFVDVLITFSKRSEKGARKVTMTLFQNVRVLGLRMSTGKTDPRKTGVLVLELTPEDCQHLISSVVNGHRFDVVVRREGDDGTEDLEATEFQAGARSPSRSVRPSKPEEKAQE